MWKLYELVKIISVFIRQYCLPNPFAGLENAEGLNWMAGLVLYPVTYIVVGVFYRPGSNPTLGAFLYLMFYAVHTGLIALCGVFNFAKIACIIIGVSYIVLLGWIKSLQLKL